jgi:hypothetical protein
MMTQVRVIEKRAIELQSGDTCVGPSIDFTERGTVESVVAVDAGAQINWVGGTYTLRPEDYLIKVQVVF